MRLVLHNVAKTFRTAFGRTEALRGIDLQVESGEFFVLLGPSGCGKSTLLNLLAGLENPSGGEIIFGERVTASCRHALSPRERNVAMVFQSYALYPHLSVYENIAFPLRVSKAERATIDSAVRRAAESLGIGSLLKSRPADLSGGQRQRVAIARAIVREPDLFLMDEPLSNLDAQLRSATRIELKDLQRRLGITTVYVTHDQVEAMTLGDRVALLREGRLEQIGTPRELYETPRTPFVAAFIGSPPMNLLPARLERKDGVAEVWLEERKIELPEGTNVPGGRCLLGIRPEHIELRTEGGLLTGIVQSVETLGREDLLHLKCGALEICALTSETHSVGETVPLKFDLEKVHLFPGDKVSGPF